MAGCGGKVIWESQILLRQVSAYASTFVKTFANMFDIQITAQKYMFSCSAKFLLHAFVEKLFKEEKFDSLRFAAISVLIHRSPLRCSFGFAVGSISQLAPPIDRQQCGFRRGIHFSEERTRSCAKITKNGLCVAHESQVPLGSLQPTTK